MHFGISPTAAIAGAGGGEGGEGGGEGGGGGNGGEKKGKKEEKQDGVEKEVDMKAKEKGKRKNSKRRYSRKSRVWWRGRWKRWSIRKSRGRRRNRRTLVHFHHQIQGRGQGRPRLMHQRKRNYCCIARILMRLRENCSGCVANIAQISMHLSTFHAFITFGEVKSIFSRLHCILE